MDGEVENHNVKEGGEGHPDYQVKINGAAISPSPLNVPTNILVYFKNVGANTAAISGSGPNGEWGTGDIAPGDDAYTYFSKADTYIYSNTEVTGSRAVIIVSDDEAEGDAESEEDDNS